MTCIGGQDNPDDLELVKAFLNKKMSRVPSHEPGLFRQKGTIFQNPSWQSRIFNWFYCDDEALPCGNLFCSQFLKYWSIQLVEQEVFFGDFSPYIYNMLKV